MTRVYHRSRPKGGQPAGPRTATRDLVYPARVSGGPGPSLGAFVLAALVACRAEDPALISAPAPLSTAEPEDDPAPAATPAPFDGPPLSRDEVRLVVRSKMAVVRGCFDAGLGQDPDIGGRVVLGFVIAPSGRAEQVEISSDEVGAGVAACLAEAVASWQFPRPRDQQPMAISYPFVFSSEASLRAAGLPRVEGTLAPKAVGAVFDARRAELDECIPDEAQGSLSLALLVDDGGAVTRISVVETSLDQPTSACVSRTVAGWRFPPAARGDEARINHELQW